MAFGMTVIGVTRTKKPHEYADEVLDLSSIKSAFRRSDFVLVALPLTPDTAGCIGREELDCLPTHAGLVNIGRANVIDYDAIVEKLKNGSLSGAILDVFYQEPLPPASDLWSVPNLLITPHCGLDDPSDYGSKCLRVFTKNLVAYRDGKAMNTIVDTALGY